MLDSVIAYIGEVFLDAVIDKSQSIKISKEKKNYLYHNIFINNSFLCCLVFNYYAYRNLQLESRPVYINQNVCC